VNAIFFFSPSPIHLMDKNFVLAWGPLFRSPGAGSGPFYIQEEAQLNQQIGRTRLYDDRRPRKSLLQLHQTWPILCAERDIDFQWTAAASRINRFRSNFFWRTCGLCSSIESSFRRPDTNGSCRTARTKVPVSAIPYK
jgi:hypothetical protein